MLHTQGTRLPSTRHLQHILAQADRAYSQPIAQRPQPADRTAPTAGRPRRTQDQPIAQHPQSADRTASTAGQPRRTQDRLIAQRPQSADRTAPTAGRPRRTQDWPTAPRVQSRLIAPHPQPADHDRTALTADRSRFALPMVLCLYLADRAVPRAQSRLIAPHPQPANHDCTAPTVGRSRCALPIVLCLYSADRAAPTAGQSSGTDCRSSARDASTSRNLWQPFSELERLAWSPYDHRTSFKSRTDNTKAHAPPTVASNAIDSY